MSFFVYLTVFFLCMLVGLMYLLSLLLSPTKKEKIFPFLQYFAYFALLPYFFWAGFIKIIAHEITVNAMTAMGYPLAIIQIIGYIEVLSVLGAVLGIFFKNHQLKNISIFFIACTLLCAVMAHLPQWELYHWISGFGLLTASLVCLLTDPHFKIRF